MMAVPEETRHEQRPMYLGYICPGCANPVLLKTTLDIQVHFLQPDGKSPEQAMTYAADAAARALENCGRMQQPLSAFSNVRHTQSTSARFRLGSYGTPCPFCGSIAPWQNPRRAVLPLSRAPLDSFPRVFFDRSDAIEWIEENGADCLSRRIRVHTPPAKPPADERSVIDLWMEHYKLQFELSGMPEFEARRRAVQLYQSVWKQMQHAPAKKQRAFRRQLRAIRTQIAVFYRSICRKQWALLEKQAPLRTRYWTLCGRLYGFTGQSTIYGRDQAVCWVTDAAEPPEERIREAFARRHLPYRIFPCRICGSAVLPGSRFCQVCGAKVN